MPVNDPIADFLTRIRNALMAGHDFVPAPSSHMLISLAKILKEEGFIQGYEVLRDKHQGTIKIRLKYGERRLSSLTGLERVSKPGLRIYVGKGEIPRLYGGLGVAILSTSRGVMTGQEARRQKVGGELLCYVW